jgi:ABC-type nickel/cobalt efflux system permease component RcnA
MKSKVIIIIFSILLLAGFVVWGVKKSHNHDHENCTEHDHSTHNHENCTDPSHSHVTPNQESFKVEADTVKRSNSHDGHNH